MYHRKLKKSKVILIITFGIFAIISNFTGVIVEDYFMMDSGLLLKIDEAASIANTRTLTIGVSGIIGGPIVGISVGLISGIVRCFQGGISPHTYLVSSILIGTISGIIGKKSLGIRREPMRLLVV